MKKGSDSRTQIVLFYYKIKQKGKCVIDSVITKMKLKLWGVDYGEECMFWGIPFIYRTPNSKILIGSRCRFRSSSTSNFRGINHQCILQTATQEAKIKIGDSCGFSGTSIACANCIVIEDNCIFGANTHISDYDSHSDRYPTNNKPIKIGHHSWLGMNVTVLKGVTIGHHVVVGAGSIVTKDLPDYCLAVGSPAKVIKILKK